LESMRESGELEQPASVSAAARNANRSGKVFIWIRCAGILPALPRRRSATGEVPRTPGAKAPKLPEFR
jgi:hypothetical protein